MDLSTLHLLINLHHLQSGRINLDDIIKRNLLEQNVRHSLGGIKSILKPIPRSCDDEAKGVKRPNMDNDDINRPSNKQKISKYSCEEKQTVSIENHQKMMGRIRNQPGHLPKDGNQSSQGCDTSFKKRLTPDIMYADRDRNFGNLYENVSRVNHLGCESLIQSPNILNRNFTHPLNDFKLPLNDGKRVFQSAHKVAMNSRIKTDKDFGSSHGKWVSKYDSSITANCSKDISCTSKETLNVNMASRRISGEFAQDILSYSDKALHDKLELKNQTHSRLSETFTPSSYSREDRNNSASNISAPRDMLRHCLNTRDFTKKSQYSKVLKLDCDSSDISNIHRLQQSNYPSASYHNLGKPQGFSAEALSSNYQIEGTVKNFAQENLPQRSGAGHVSFKTIYHKMKIPDDRTKDEHEADPTSREFEIHNTSKEVPDNGAMAVAGKSNKDAAVEGNLEARYKMPVLLELKSKSPADLDEIQATITSLISAQTFFQSPPFVENKEKLREKHIAYIQSLKEQTSSSCRPTNPDEQAKAELAWLTGFVETTVVTMIKFAKAVPGFKSISLQDQAKLLKCSKSESLLSGGMVCFDKIQGIMTMPDGHHCKFEDLAKALSKEFVERKIEMISKLDELKLSERETAILRAITIVFPDRCVLEDRPKVEVIYKKLLDCLIYEVRAHHTNIEERVRQIFDILNLLKDVLALQRPPMKRAFESEGVLESKPLIAEFM